MNSDYIKIWEFLHGTIPAFFDKVPPPPNLHPPAGHLVEVSGVVNPVCARTWRDFVVIHHERGDLTKIGLSPAECHLLLYIPAI